MLAYVDPGLGQFLFQMLSAMVVGVLFSVRKVRRFLFEAVRARFRKQADPVPPSRKDAKP